jgi:hypothetical protein
VKAIFGLLMAAAMLLAACGDGAIEEPAAETTETTAAAETTTTTTTETTSTTAAPATTTTTQPTASTTAASAATSDLKALIARVEAVGESTSSRIEGSTRVIGLSTTVGANGDVTIPISAAYDGETGNSSFSVDTAAAVVALAEGDGLADMEDPLGTVERRKIGDISYIKYSFFNMMFGAQTAWISMPQEVGFGDELLEGILTYPTEVLEAYQDADTQVEEIGRETVNAVETTHFVIDIDTRSLLAQMSEEERAGLAASVPLHTGTFSMEVWLSDDGYLVRMVVEVDGSKVEEVEPGVTFERMISTFDVFDIGQQITIEPPPASEVTPIEALTGMFEIEID